MTGRSGQAGITAESTASHSHGENAVELASVQPFRGSGTGSRPTGVAYNGVSYSWFSGRPRPQRTTPVGHALAIHGSSETRSDDYHTTVDDIQQLLRQIRPDEDLDGPDAEHQPSGLNVQLLPHQIRGVVWMKHMEDGITKGGILADDIGLGKTVQAITLMLARPPPCEGRPTLVVCPVALLDQWCSELHGTLKASHTPRVMILHGWRARTP